MTLSEGKFTWHTSVAKKKITKLSLKITHLKFHTNFPGIIYRRQKFWHKRHKTCDPITHTLSYFTTNTQKHLRSFSSDRFYKQQNMDCSTVIEVWSSVFLLYPKLFDRPILPGPCFFLKTDFPIIGFPSWNKTVMRLSYLYNENFYTGKTPLYWNGLYFPKNHAASYPMTPLYSHKNWYFSLHLVKKNASFNSLAPGRCGCNLKLVIFKLTSRVDRYIEHFMWNCPQVNDATLLTQKLIFLLALGEKKCLF